MFLLIIGADAAKLKTMMKDPSPQTSHKALLKWIEKMVTLC